MVITEASRLERLIHLAVTLKDGRKLTTAEAAQMTGVSVRTAQRDFATISRILPIYPEGGQWLYLDDDSDVKISPY